MKNNIFPVYCSQNSSAIITHTGTKSIYPNNVTLF